MRLLVELADDPERTLRAFADDPVERSDDDYGELADVRVVQGALEYLLALAAVPGGLADGVSWATS